MHVVLALTATHDRVLSLPDEKPTVTELFHHYKATKLFNSRLTSSISTSSERDAIWIAFTFIGAMQMCDVRGKSPEEAWPLKAPEPDEPSWLTLTLGKHSISDLCDPSRADSCFRALSGCKIRDSDSGFTPDELKDGGFHNLPREVLECLNLDDVSTWTSSPYFRAANILSQLMPIEYNQMNMLKYLTFIQHMQPEFRELWVKKDPGVLLLLSYWYAKCIPFQQWWTWKRSVLECQSICTFLERYHSDIPHLEQLLEFPKHSCGLVVTRSIVAEPVDS